MNRYPDGLITTRFQWVLLHAEYHHLLSPLGTFGLKETEYVQLLAPSDDGQPVRRVLESTFARPILSVPKAEEQMQLIALYEAVIGSANPDAPNGSSLFPLRRMFFTLTKAAG